MNNLFGRGGRKVLTVFALVMVCYFLVGAALKFQVQGSRGIHVVPHLEFWLEYPQVVKEGLLISVAFVKLNVFPGNSGTSRNDFDQSSAAPLSPGGGNGADAVKIPIPNVVSGTNANEKEEVSSLCDKFEFEPIATPTNDSFNSFA